MPLCISCRGEYWAPPEDSQETKEPPANSAMPLPLGEEVEEAEPESAVTALPLSPSSSLEQVYGVEKLPPFICARCRQSNERWHQWDRASGFDHFSRFFFFSVPWGWLALSSFVLPVIAALAIDFVPVASERIGIPLAILLIFVNFSLLYALKESLWRYDLLARAGRGFRLPLAMYGIIFFVVALIFGLAIVFMLEARAATPEAGRTEGLVRVTTTILLAMTFVNVTLSAMFMSAHDYSKWLNQEMPQPLYAQERRLLRVIKNGLASEIRRAMGRDRATGEERAVEAIIVDVERTADAGVILLIDTEIDADQVSEKGSLKQLQSWRITTDRWGRLIKMTQEGTPRYITIEESSASSQTEAGEGEKSTGVQPVPATNGEIIPAHEGYLAEIHKTRSDTTISITSSRKHWVE